MIKLHYLSIKIVDMDGTKICNTIYWTYFKKTCEEIWTAHFDVHTVL